MILNFSPFSIDDLIKAHSILMKDLVKDNGQFRKGGVGVFAGEKFMSHYLDIKQTEQAAEQVKKLIKVITQKPKSANELMKLVGIKHKLTFRDNYLKSAINLGLVLMTVPDKLRSSK